MRLPRRRLLLFAGPILLPGLILGWLSFRSVKDERLLLERSREARYESFADAMEQTLLKTRNEHMDRVRGALAGGGSAETPLAAWELAARLIELPVVHSAVVFRGETPVFPAPPREPPVEPEAFAEHPLENVVREEWRAGRHASALQAVRLLLYGPDPLDPRMAEKRFGFRLLELKCLARLGLASEAEGTARVLVADLLESADFETRHRTGFYLAEIADLMTSLEPLTRGARSEFFALHQRLPAFLSNAEAIDRDWQGSPEELLRALSPARYDTLRVRYHHGTPYLAAGFPWLDRDTRVLVRLDEGVFSAAVRSELVQERRAPWRDMDFAVFAADGKLVLSADHDDNTPREPALERALELDLPSWRLVVYKRSDAELVAQGRWRTGIHYALLAFSLLSLLLGILALYKGLDDAQRLISMKANFLSAVSHELKTPLTAIRMFSEMLASERMPESKRPEYARRIGAEAERLQGMIEGILTFTRLEENPGALRLAQTDLTEAARESAALMAAAFEKAGIRLVQRLDAPAMLDADHDALRSVVQNLLENALKYSRPATQVTLEVLPRSEDIVLRVADQGVGISPEDQRRIFEKFWRAGDEMTRKTRGSGLGLALVKRITDAHGGTIRVESKPGEGTEMILTFPRKGGTDAPHPDR